MILGPVETPQIAQISRGAGWHGNCAFEGAVTLGAGPGRLGRMNRNDAKKPQVDKSAVAVTVLDRLLTYLRPVILVGTILVLCLAVYAMSVYLTKR